MIIYHADDYGLSVNVSKEILTLMNMGKLDGISVISNMKCFPTCMKMLNSYTGAKRVEYSIHLNLMEGHCLAKEKEVTLLTTKEGYFQLSWKQLFFISYIPGKRKKYLAQLKEEVKAQIQVFMNEMPKEYILRIDSHQHTQFIPVVWDAIRLAVKELSLDVEFVRYPVEPFLPYISTPGLYKTFPISGAIKNWILRFCAIHAKCHPIATSKEKFRLWGLVMGCNMDYDRVERLMPKFKKHLKESTTLCLLFHPGTILPEEISSEYSNPDFLKVETSNNRKMEYQTILKRN